MHQTCVILPVDSSFLGIVDANLFLLKHCSAIWSLKFTALDRFV